MWRGSNGWELRRCGNGKERNLGTINQGVFGGMGTRSSKVKCMIPYEHFGWKIWKEKAWMAFWGVDLAWESLLQNNN